MHVRTAQPDELDALAKIWCEAWHDAHAALVPVEYAEVRTVANFRERLPELLPDLRVAGDVGTPLGFSITKDDELNQFYVSREARGTGVAQALIAEAEERLAATGVGTAWLACAVGNNRAARFYEKSGWHLARTYFGELQVQDGIFKLEIWRYEKELLPIES